MEYVQAKTILTKAKKSEFWFDTDYNMNLYRGCCHKCIYCDSRSDCYQIENFDQVRAKEDAINILNKELVSKREKGVISVGAMSDSYNPHEETELLIRQALELIQKYKFGVAIPTKSDLITRDLDLLKKINENNDVLIKFTITTHDDELAKMIEPNAPLPSARFKALKELTDNGIFAGILLMPILPFINDTEENIINIVKKAHEAGAKFIYAYMGVTLRDNQRNYFYEQIKDIDSNLIDKYKATYGNRYNCSSPKAKKLYQTLKLECLKYNIITDIKAINRRYRKPKKQEPEQLTWL